MSIDRATRSNNLKFIARWKIVKILKLADFQKYFCSNLYVGHDYEHVDSLAILCQRLFFSCSTKKR